MSDLKSPNWFYTKGLENQSRRCLHFKSFNNIFCQKWTGILTLKPIVEGEGPEEVSSRLNCVEFAVRYGTKY